MCRIVDFKNLNAKDIGYNCYVADTLEELPLDAPFGSEAKVVKYEDGEITGIKVAVKFKAGWIADDGTAYTGE